MKAKKLVAVIAMIALFCTFSVGALADNAQPDEAYLAEQLQVSLPMADGAETFGAKEDDVTVSGNDTACEVEVRISEKMTGQADGTVTVALVSDKDGNWSIEEGQPIVINPKPDKNADKEEDKIENDDTLKAPTQEELEALLETEAVCKSHGKKAVDLDKAGLQTVVYADEAGVVHALVSFDSHVVAESVSKQLEFKHVASRMDDMRFTYTLTKTGDSWQKSGLKLTFAMLETYTVTYTDGANGEVFEDVTYTLWDGAETPKMDDPVREGYDFDGWQPEVSEKVTEDVVYTPIWTKLFTVTYTDGVDNEVVFEDESFIVRDGDPTPTVADPEREGYDFDGWQPEVAETVTADAVYSPVWTRLYTVTYTDGVEDEEVFADESFTVRDGDATPTIDDPEREGFVFNGWKPEVDETVTKDVSYEAQWLEIFSITYEGVPSGVNNPNPTEYVGPRDAFDFEELTVDGFIGWLDEDGNAIDGIKETDTGDRVITANIISKPRQPSLGTNIADGIVKWVCTTHPDEHHVEDLGAMMDSGAARDVKWNAELKRWEGTLKTRTFNITNSNVQRQYFGGMTHHYDNADRARTIAVYWDPTDVGTTATGNPQNGFWHVIGDQVVIDVWCYDAPVAPQKTTQVSGTTFWVRDCFNTKNNTKLTKVSSFTAEDVTKDEKGDFWVKIWLSADDAIASFQNKYGSDYTLCLGESEEGHAKDAANHGKQKTLLPFMFKYTGSKTDYKQDGSGWKFDEAATMALNEGNYKRYNGYQIWMRRNLTVTYNDGVDDTVVFADQVYTVCEGTATPEYQGAEPVREGYVFNGWAPAIEKTVTSSITYQAQWLQVYTITYENVPEGVSNPNPTSYVGPRDTVTFVDLEGVDGFIGWLDEDGNTVTGISATESGDRVIKANIVAKPIQPKLGTNIADGIVKWVCTAHPDEHQVADLGAMMDSGAARDVKWNAALKRWEGTLKTRTFNITNSNVQRQFFGGITHHYENADRARTIAVYWDPADVGTTSTGNPQTGFWHVIGDQVVINVWCYDQPAAPKTVSNNFYLRDCFNSKNYNRSTVKTTVNADEVEVVKENGEFYVTVTVDATDAINAFLKKYPGYVVCAGEGDDSHGAQATKVTAVFRYTGSKTDYKQDGSGWTFDSAKTAATTNGTLNSTAFQIWMSRNFTVTYTDGVDDAEVFADQTFTVREGSATPSYTPDVDREGYSFAGWTPELAAKVTADTTYTAVWTKTEIYTITYENVPEGVENPNPTSYEGPKQVVTFEDIATDGFVGWVDEEGKPVTGITADQTGNVTVKANIVAKPVQPRLGTNMAEGIVTFKCTMDDAHGTNDNAFLNNGAARDVKWNAEAKRWEASVTTRTSNLNLTVPMGNYLGGIKHYWDKADNARKVPVYWVPDEVGKTATGNEQTGFWHAIEPTTVEIWCFDAPAAPQKVSQVSSSIKFRAEDCTNSKVNYSSVSADVTAFTADEVRNENGIFYVTLWVDAQNAINKFNGKYPGYSVCTGGESDKHGEQVTRVPFVFKYTGSTTDYKQDGSGWVIDKDATAKLGVGNYVSKSGYYMIYMSKSFTVTYTDGVEDAEVFADKVLTVKSGAATPSFGENPTREGYTFAGWNPAVAEKVTENATYTATWTAVAADGGNAAEPAEPVEAEVVEETDEPVEGSEGTEIPAEEAVEESVGEVEETPKAEEIAENAAPAEGEKAVETPVVPEVPAEPVVKPVAPIEKPDEDTQA